MLRRLIAGTVLALALVAAAGAGDGPSFQEIEESLTCQCGCGLTVHSCNHLQCPSALPLRAEIREQMATGKDRDELLAYFGDKYGEKILSAPTTAGFNLLAWLTPFIAVFIGVLLVLLIVRHWRQPGPPGDDEAPPVEQPQSPYREILERELKSFDQ